MARQLFRSSLIMRNKLMPASFVGKNKKKLVLTLFFTERGRFRQNLLGSWTKSDSASNVHSFLWFFAHFSFCHCFRAAKWPWLLQIMLIYMALFQIELAKMPYQNLLLTKPFRTMYSKYYVRSTMAFRELTEDFEV